MTPAERTNHHLDHLAELIDKTTDTNDADGIHRHDVNLALIGLRRRLVDERAAVQARTEERDGLLRECATEVRDLREQRDTAAGEGAHYQAKASNRGRELDTLRAEMDVMRRQVNSMSAAAERHELQMRSLVADHAQRITERDGARLALKATQRGAESELAKLRATIGNMTTTAKEQQADSADLVQQVLELLKERNEAIAKLAQVTAERDLAIAHDRQPYPTAAAYEAVCAALEKAKTERDAALAELDKLKDTDTRAELVLVRDHLAKVMREREEALTDAAKNKSAADTFWSELNRVHRMAAVEFVHWSRTELQANPRKVREGQEDAAQGTKGRADVARYVAESETKEACSHCSAPKDKAWHLLCAACWSLLPEEARDALVWHRNQHCGSPVHRVVIAGALSWLDIEHPNGPATPTPLPAEVGAAPRPEPILEKADPIAWTFTCPDCGKACGASAVGDCPPFGCGAMPRPGQVFPAPPAPPVMVPLHNRGNTPDGFPLPDLAGGVPPTAAHIRCVGCGMWYAPGHQNSLCPHARVDAPEPATCLPCNCEHLDRRRGPHHAVSCPRFTL